MITVIFTANRPALGTYITTPGGFTLAGAVACIAIPTAALLAGGTWHAAIGFTLAGTIASVAIPTAALLAGVTWLLGYYARAGGVQT